jgi:hypothetical protein
MARRNEALDAITGVLDEAGIAFVVEHGGKHLKIWFHANGRMHRLICSVSPSDVNTRHDARRQVQRALRELRP